MKAMIFSTQRIAGELASDAFDPAGERALRRKNNCAIGAAQLKHLRECVTPRRRSPTTFSPTKIFAVGHGEGNDIGADGLIPPIMTPSPTRPN
jgi:hypothetical protein